MTESQKAQYEEAAKEYASNYGSLMKDHIQTSFAVGCEHADTVATNRTLNQVDEILVKYQNDIISEHIDNLKLILEELKKLRK